MEHSPRRVAIVTGGNRGIGLAVCRQLALNGVHVQIGARRFEDAEREAVRLVADGHAAAAVQLDIRSEDDVRRAVASTARSFGRLDILVNNAAALYDTWQSSIDVDFETVRSALDINLFGAWRMCRAAIPLMLEGHYGRIVNVGSVLGSMTEMWSASPAYSVSKASLNMLTRLLSKDLKDTGILVNSICPGWTETEMGGEGGRPVSEAAKGILWAATLPEDGPTGGFYHDGAAMAW